MASEKVRSSRVGSKPCGSKAWRRPSSAVLATSGRDCLGAARLDQDAAGDREEQLVAGRLAQAAQGVADGGLRHRQLGGGARDVALDHHRAEDAQQVEIESAEVHRPGRRRHGARSAFMAVMGGFEMAISQ